LSSSGSSPTATSSSSPFCRWVWEGCGCDSAAQERVFLAPWVCGGAHGAMPQLCVDTPCVSIDTLYTTWSGCCTLASKAATGFWGLGGNWTQLGFVREAFPFFLVAPAHFWARASSRYLAIGCPVSTHAAPATVHPLAPQPLADEWEGLRALAWEPCQCSAGLTRWHTGTLLQLAWTAGGGGKRVRRGLC
jgi:hypothetical protein